MTEAFNTLFMGQTWWFTPVVLATWEPEIQRIQGQGQPSKTPSQPGSLAWWHTPALPVTWRHR
jgi:hypothetical protein